MQVEASEKSSGKKEVITIKAEKGRLSDEEIERMVSEAEQYKEQDEAYAGKVEARVWGCFPLDKVVAAFNMSYAGDAVGKLGISVS